MTLRVVVVHSADAVVAGIAVRLGYSEIGNWHVTDQNRDTALYPKAVADIL